MNVNLNKTDTISTLAKTIIENQDLSLYQQRLFLGNKALENDKSIEYYGI